MRPDRASTGRRWWRGLAAALALAASLPAQAQAPTASELRLRVEGAFLVNFVRYTDWPEQRFTEPGAPYVVSVVGDAEATDAIAAVATAAGSIRGRRIVVRRVRFDARLDPASRRVAIRRLRESHVVFVAGGDVEGARLVLRAVAGAPVLTVSDVPGFAAAGGMLGLVRSGRNLAIEANPAAIRDSEMQVSAKVLKLARLWGAP
ncbi:YfiR family protein [Cognatiluteimonas lumbrici]|uniref:YfiR family protein n=1 Tax=Cognatiluteimonas lumbrici TaxID=2559601 RepID=UPI0015E3B7D9|nr:YfiR family protein [Luteimonas lumbrici]